MPVTSWHPERVYTPLLTAFAPAALQTLAYAKATAPGPNTRAQTKVRFQGRTAAQIDARSVPGIVPIIKGSRPGERDTSGYFVIPGTSPAKVVRAIRHPGTPPHPYLNRAAALFPVFYGASARKFFGTRF